jgi:hypothetical protein
MPRITARNVSDIIDLTRHRRQKKPRSSRLFGFPPQSQKGSRVRPGGLANQPRGPDEGAGCKSAEGFCDSRPGQLLLVPCPAAQLLTLLPTMR